MIALLDIEDTRFEYDKGHQLPFICMIKALHPRKRKRYVFSGRGKSSIVAWKLAMEEMDKYLKEEG